MQSPFVLPQLQANFRPSAPYFPNRGWGLSGPKMPWPAVTAVMPNSTMVITQQVQAEQAKNMGNEFRRRKLYTQAAQSYQTAIQTDPTYTDAYFNLAQLQNLTGYTQQGIQTLAQLLAINPHDDAARVLLGTFYETMGNPQEAKKRYIEVLNAQPGFNPAQRHLDYLLFLDQKRFYPDTANALLETRYKEMNFSVQKLLGDYFTKVRPNSVYAKLLQTTPLVFEPTQMNGDNDNIGEYDAMRNVIRLAPQMLFSKPAIVAAYVVHELVHAADQDSLSSIVEEQDAYRETARFLQQNRWITGADPNLDLTLQLFEKSPDSLDQEVRRVYSIQDPSLPETSPGHGQTATSSLTLAAQADALQSNRLSPEEQKQLQNLLIKSLYQGVLPKQYA